MTTTIHIPQQLLMAIDRKIAELNISRNKFICMVLQKEVEGEWPPSFYEKPLKQNEDLSQVVDEMMSLLKQSRVNKKGPSL